MEIYKDIQSPASKEFIELLNGCSKFSEEISIAIKNEIVIKYLYI